MGKPSRQLAIAGVLVAVLCWAGNALVARAFAGEIPPFALAFWRWSLALILIAVSYTHLTLPTKA